MTDIQWIAGIVAILAGLGSVVVAVVRLQHGIGQQFEQTRRESEDRAVVTHQRIDLLGRTIDQTYLRKDVHEAHIQRLDGEIANIKGSLGCPAAAPPSST